MSHAKQLHVHEWDRAGLCTHAGCFVRRFKTPTAFLYEWPEGPKTCRAGQPPPCVPKEPERLHHAWRLAPKLVGPGPAHEPVEVCACGALRTRLSAVGTIVYKASIADRRFSPDPPAACAPCRRRDWPRRSPGLADRLQGPERPGPAPQR